MPDDLSAAEKQEAVVWWISELRAALIDGDDREGTRLIRWSGEISKFAKNVLGDLTREEES